MKLIYALLLMLLCSCDGHNYQQHCADIEQERVARVNHQAINAKQIRHLPDNAVIEHQLGNGWVVFSISGNKYIYRYTEAHFASTEVLAPWTDN